MRFSFLILFFFLPICFITAQPLQVDLFSKNAILINAETSAILYEKKSSEKAYPASITKIATALYVLDQKKQLLDEIAKASPDALHCISSGKKLEKASPYWLESGGSSFGLISGEEISFKTLLYGLMLVSGNDCANVIAESSSGNISVFMKELNDYLKALGCKNTNFCNPHGLHHKDHFTTAADMAIITRKALSIPQFRQIVSTLSYTTAKTNKHKRREISQCNRLLRKGKHHYPYAIGVKTGFHSSAGYNLVAAATHGNRTLIAVLLGGEKNDYRYIDAKHLFDAAFSEEKVKKEIFEDNKIFLASIDGAKDNLQAYLKNGLDYEYYPAEECCYKVMIKWDDLKLPIKKDAKVGQVQLVSQEGYILASSSLHAKEKVSKSFSFMLKDFFKKIF